MQAASEQQYAWVPDEKLISSTVQTAFLRAEGLADHEALSRRADEDPGWLWDAVIRFADLQFFRPYDKIMDDSGGPAWTKWCTGGTTNHVLNCIDRHRSSSCQDKTFIIWQGENGATRKLTWREFDEQVCRIASGLLRLGISRGDVVGLFMPSLPETYIAYFAALKIGAVAAPLFSGFGPAAIAQRLDLAKAKAVITAQSTSRRGKIISMKAILDDALADAPSVEHVIVVGTDGPSLPMSQQRDVLWQDLLANSMPLADTVAMACDEPAVIHFTSGTTGKPKGCVYTHIGLAAKMAWDHGILTDFRATDRHLCMADMGWMVGSKSATIPSLHGASMVIAEGIPDYPNPGRIWDLIAEHKVSWIELSPAVARTQMRYPASETSGRDLSSLRIILTGGEAWQERPWRWLQKQCGAQAAILDSAGGTEVSGSILMCDLHHPVKIGAFSIAIPGMQADIVDENGCSVAAGQMGELAMRGSSIGLTAGLFGEPERYEQNYWGKHDGLWSHGDLCSRDPTDGHWRLHGRTDDTLKVAGKRIGPSEIESAAMSSGLVAECAAVAATDEHGASVVALAAVPLAADAADSASAGLRDAIGRDLGRSFVPQRIYFVDMLPKTRSQKIMRRSVRAAIADEQCDDVSMIQNPEAISMLRTAAKQQ